MPAKNIALFIDGTWNEATGREDTNVRKLFEMSLLPGRADAPQQLSYYIPGVGRDMTGREAEGDPLSMASMARFREGRDEFELRESVLFRTTFGRVAGWGTAARIREAYAFLCQHYDRASGDRVYIFGFSRGAFAARSLTGFISLVGLLFADKLDHVGFAYELYERGQAGAQSWLAAYVRRLTDSGLITSDDDSSALRVHFIGVWDTVGSMGIPRRKTQFTAPYTEYHQVTVPPNVMVARHAMAVHEMREDFQLMLWSNPNQHGNLKQVWFPGNHADVGGGHPLPESGFSDEALAWMADEAGRFGLRLSAFVAYHHRVLHQQWGWFFIGATFPRWQLQMLDDVAAVPWRHQPFDEWQHSAYFHQTVGAAHTFPTPPWWARRHRKDILSKLHDVDSRARELAMSARLHGLYP